MSIVIRIKDLCTTRNTDITNLERDLGLSKSSISKWVKSSPNSDSLQKIADYFHVTTDYLLGREKDEKDIARTMDKIKRQLLTEQGLMFDGEILDEETANLLLEEIERQERIVKAVNKKYTPKKYR